MNCARGYLAIVLALSGCGSPDPVDRAARAQRPESEPSRPDPEPMQSRPSAEAPRHWLPGPWRGRDAAAGTDRAALEAGCRSCHATTTHQWRSSQHAGAWTDPAFADAFAREPLPFCQSCHAPEVPPDAEVPAWAADIGIGCVTCHVEPGDELVWTAGARFERPASSSAPHALARSPRFAAPEACAGCHEFAFPDSRLRPRPRPMQSTVTEHRRSAHALRSCADCHMPASPEGRDHRFPGAHDPKTLREALAIEVRRDAEQIRFELRPAAVGHAVPTGDHLRRLELSLALVDEDGLEQVLSRRWLGRAFRTRVLPGGLTGHSEVEDTRVGPEGATLVIPIPPRARDRELRWRVTHQRVADPGRDPTEAILEGELELASGLIAAPG